MNKIVIAQIDTIAGDIKQNSIKIVDCINRAKHENADLIIFPEFALTGYPYGNILERNKSILIKQQEALNEIVKTTKNITAAVGFANEKNTEIISSIAVIQNEKIINSSCFQINEEKFLVVSDGINENDLSEMLINKTPDTVIHCACGISRLGSEYIKNEFFSSVSKKYGVNYIYVNKSGYADNFVFNGTSKIYDKTGRLILRAKTFDEDFVITTLESENIKNLPIGMDKKINFDNFDLNYTDDLDRTYKSIVYAIKQYFFKNGFKKAVLGLSGGLDSSVCAVLLTDALGAENVRGISMPSKITSNQSKGDAKILAENLGIHFLEIPLADFIEPAKLILNSAFEKIKTEKYENSATIENLQARTRATILWSISNEYKQMLPIATSDKSEAYIGYATVNGDMSGGFAPIADVTKTKLFALADFLNNNREQKGVIPQSVLQKPPGAELKLNPKTGLPVYAEEDNMPYEFLDEIIWYIENKHFGRQELLSREFLYEKKHKISTAQKEEWINKFFWKSKCAVYKWHIMPPSVIVDSHSINPVEYRIPIISKI